MTLIIIDIYYYYPYFSDKLCVRDFIEVLEQNPWKELPITWSVPKPGEVCKMTELLPSDPEFMEVERNVRKTSGNISIRIDSVSLTHENFSSSLS